MAQKKGGGSTRNGRDSESKRLGVKVYGGQAINAGGIIDVHHQRIGSSARVKRSHIGRIETTLSGVLQRADEQHRQPRLIAEELAEEYLAQGASAALLKTAC